MPYLSVVTTLVNLFFLLVSLWLGLYLVTRSSHSHIAWMGSLTVWAAGAWFLHNALQGGITNRVWTDWLGQVMKLSVPMWFHLTCLLRFEAAPPSKAMRTFMNVLIVAGYALVILQILESSGATGTTVPVDFQGPALQFSDRWITTSFPLFLSLLILLPALSINNLWQARRMIDRPLLRKQFSYLMLAGIVTFVTAVYSGVAVLLQLDVAAFPADALLGMSVFLLGYAVASYDALLEGRPVGRDALYSAVGLFVVVVVYSFVVLLLYFNGQLTLPALVTVLIAVVITHALFDGGRAILDRVFYQSDARRLRADLRVLAIEAGSGGTLAHRLDLLLNAVRQRVEMAPGCIAIRSTDGFWIKAASSPEWMDCHLPPNALQADAIWLFEAGEIVELPQMTLLAPLYAGPDQIGALLLGDKPGRGGFSADEQAMLETLAESIAWLLQTAEMQERQAQELDQTLADFRERERELEQQQQEILAPAQTAESDEEREPELVRLVEKALRRLHKYGALSELPLAAWHVVDLQIASQANNMSKMVITPVDRAKALAQLLTQAIERLRPNDKPLTTREVPGSEWYPYIILHHSYVLEEPTRDIMSRLYISEGTYNRTRRDALRTLAMTLRAMEDAAVSEPEAIAVP